MAVTPHKCGAAKAFAEISKRVVLNGDVALQLHQQDAMMKASIVEWSSGGTIASAVGHSIGGAMAALLEVVEEYQRRWPGTPEQRRESDRRALAEVAETLRKIPPWTTETRLRLGGRVWVPLAGPDETGVIVVSEDEPEDALFIDIELFDQVEVLGDRGAAPPPATSTMTAQLCEVGGEPDDEQMVPVLLRCGLETARQLGALLYQHVEILAKKSDEAASRSESNASSRLTVEIYWHPDAGQWHYRIVEPGVTRSGWCDAAEDASDSDLIDSVRLYEFIGRAELLVQRVMWSRPRVGA